MALERWEIIPGLFVSGYLQPPDDFDALGVDAIVDLESWEHEWPAPLPPPDKILIRYAIDDAETVDTKLPHLARFVAALVQGGHRVLIHCTQGLNRSGLVAARVLIELGYTTVDAIETVRARRGVDEEGFGALGNESFVRWLLREASDTGPADPSR